MFKAASLGFTLVEILVVLAITTVAGIVAFANFAGFREDTALNNAVLDLQSQLRLAQTNSASAVICKDKGDASWFVEIQTNRIDIDLKCSSYPTEVRKPLNLKGVRVEQITGNNGVCNSNYPNNVLVVGFASPYSTANFIDSGAACIATSADLTITLKNTKTNNTKTIKIDKGGGVQ